MAEKNNLEDQLNILFDNAEEEEKTVAGGVQDENWDLSGLFEDNGKKAEEKKTSANGKKVSVSASDNARKPQAVIDDTDIRKDFEELDFSEVDEMIGSEPDIDEIESDEKESTAQEIREADERERKAIDDDPEEDEYREESRRFWIFTAVVALIVAAAVLFILYRRGIIGSQKKKTTSPTVQTVVSKESSAKETSAEKVTETEKSSETEKETSEKESESVSDTETSESPETDESTETESEETETSEEVTDESETESENSENDGDKQRVADNYENLFVVAGTGTLNVREKADAESELIATIDEFGGGSILEQEGEWYHISSGGLQGYIKAEFVKTGDEAKALAVEHAVKRVKITADTLNVRTEADTEADLLDVVNKGTVFEMIDEVNGFYRVKYNYVYEGYVSMDFSSLDWYLNEAVKYYAE